MQNGFGYRLLLKLVGLLIIAATVILLFFYFKHELTSSQTEITEIGMVQKISTMGKLELVKYTMKDIIEQKEIHAILPDSKILFLAVGEVTACIDLTKIKKSDITLGKDTIIVYLPQPEICYAKLDHQKSRVYDISGTWFADSETNMVEGVYKLAEKKIFDNANQMNVLGMARTNAQLIFKPLLENLTGKKVILNFQLALPSAKN